MEKTAILFVVISLISIVMSIREQKKKQEKKNASSSVQASKPAPVKTERNETFHEAKRLSVSALEKENPFQRDMLTGSKEERPLPFPDTVADSIFMDSEGSASEEGEDPCHSDMLTGPAESEPEAVFSDTPDSRELLRAFVLSEVLSKPKALRRKA